uniref:F-box domain-containing protein n=1 Tax=Spongospora subterranea TaxID=70186 RepID=A0A0H5RBB5_9EUKA|eukprot:CRZ10912.1 hypothetical protein [Spongospora subterranea]
MIIDNFIDQISQFLATIDVCNLLLVCSAWMQVLDVPHVWKYQLSQRDSSRLAFPSAVPMSHLTSSQLRVLLKCMRTLSAPEMSYNVIDQGVYQSSSDDFSQGLDKTLDNRKSTFWSSTGSENQNSSDLLVYRLINGLCIIKRISITPFRAFYQRGMRCYSPMEARVVIRISENDESSTTFSSPWCQITNRDEPFEFPLGEVTVFGEWLRVELRGRWSKQSSDNLYYVCLRNVSAFGVPIAVAPDNMVVQVLYDYISGKGFSSLSFLEFCRKTHYNMEKVTNMIDRGRERVKVIATCDRLIQESNVMLLIPEASQLRDTNEIRDHVVNALNEHGGTEDVMQYLAVMYHFLDVKFTEEESYFLATALIKVDEMIFFHDLVSKFRITFSERLGDIFLTSEKYYEAMVCYCGAVIPDKILSTCALLCSQPDNLTTLDVLIRACDDKPVVVAEMAAILQRKHHPYICCLFIMKAVEQLYIDLAAASDILGVRFASKQDLDELVNSQNLLFTSSATSSLETINFSISF